MIKELILKLKSIYKKSEIGIHVRYYDNGSCQDIEVSYHLNIYFCNHPEDCIKNDFNNAKELIDYVNNEVLTNKLIEEKEEKTNG